MKKLFMFLSVSLLALGAFAQPQNKKPASPHNTITAGNVKVTYGRPYKKDRVIFGELVKYGEVWRTGANEATEITFAKDGSFAGQPVKAGTYTLFTIPGQTEWTVMLNSTLKQWGAYDYDKNKGSDVLSAKVPATKLDKTVEQFTITATAKALTLAWDATSVAIPYKF